MDTELNSPPRDGDDSAAAFRKPSSDGSGRKYRRRALAEDGSSSCDGSPERNHSLDTKHSREDSRKVSEPGYARKDDRRESDRSRYGRGGRDSHRHERYSRDNDYGSKRDDYNRHERYSRDIGYGSKRDDYSRHERDGPRYSRDSRGGHHSDRRRGEAEHSKSRNEKDVHVKSPRDRSDGKCVETENRDTHSKKLRGFSSGKFTHGDTNAEEKQTSSLKPLPGAGDQGLTLQSQSKEADISGDVDAAKVAAMQAANLVNKNLVGTGYLTTDQKKKLLWGKKKSAAAEEPAHRWDSALIGDPERQEKFNKLMGVKGSVVNQEKNPSEVQVEKQKELQIDLEKQYTAGLRRRDGRTVGLGL